MAGEALTSSNIARTSATLLSGIVISQTHEISTSAKVVKNSIALSSLFHAAHIHMSTRVLPIDRNATSHVRNT